MQKKELREEARNLREEYLKNKLKILGYESIADTSKPLDPSKGYRVLGRIGHDLESFVNPIKFPFKEDEKTQNQKEKCRQEIEQDRIFIENQDEFFFRVRGIYQDFGQDMKGKMRDKEDWILYSNVVQKTAILCKNLIRGELSRKPQMLQQDMISELIDSEEFAKACKIEDAFMKEEIENFKVLAEMYEYEDEDICNTYCAVNLAELVRESQSTADKKNKHIEAYAEYVRFLNVIKGKNSRLILKSSRGELEDNDDRR